MNESVFSAKDVASGWAFNHESWSMTHYTVTIDRIWQQETDNNTICLKKWKFIAFRQKMNLTLAFNHLSKTEINFKLLLPTNCSDFGII